MCSPISDREVVDGREGFSGDGEASIEKRRQRVAMALACFEVDHRTIGIRKEGHSASIRLNPGVGSLSDAAPDLFVPKRGARQAYMLASTHRHPCPIAVGSRHIQPSGDACPR